MEFAKQRPTERSLLFSEVQTRSVVGALVEAIPAVADQTRKDLEMWEWTGRLAPREREPTEEEKKKENDDLARIKAEWLKKAKKKKWTEDDEKQLVEKYRQTTIDRVSQ